MHYLYGLKPSASRRLVETFDTQAQLLAYVGWATLKVNPDGTRAFEQGRPLVGYNRFEFSAKPSTVDDETTVVHNPTPSML
jgi:hypothetical protein